MDRSTAGAGADEAERRVYFSNAEQRRGEQCRLPHRKVESATKRGRKRLLLFLPLPLPLPLVCLSVSPSLCFSQSLPPFSFFPFFPLLMYPPSHRCWRHHPGWTASSIRRFSSASFSPSPSPCPRRPQVPATVAQTQVRSLLLAVHSSVARIIPVSIAHRPLARLHRLHDWALPMMPPLCVLWKCANYHVFFPTVHPRVNLLPRSQSAT